MAEKKDVDEIISKEPAELKSKLDSDELTTLYLNSLRHGLFAVSGKAGSGKTHAVINLVTKFRGSGKLPIFVFTPTGKANLVIRQRLKDVGLHRDSKIRISTIHRFLYRALLDYFVQYTSRRGEAFRLQDLISRILSGKLESMGEFKLLARSWAFNPKVVIIDEASMVDEVLLAVLLTMINTDTVEHLILVGDERQLPPIGIGRPFLDLIFDLKRKGLESNLIHLESNLRFDPTKSLARLSEFFGSSEQPDPAEIEETLRKHDDSLELHYFSNTEDLMSVMKGILNQLGSDRNKTLFEMFTEIFESNGELSLDKVQIIAPRRVGDFGSTAINWNIVLEGTMDYIPKSKLICEENIYFNAGRSRVLGLANGSIGYIKEERYVYFDDILDLFNEYRREDVMHLINEVREDVYSPLKIERKIDLGYAITVHKAQGSDFERVILVLSRSSSLITRELLYTALTRPREKLHLLVYSRLKDELAHDLVKAHMNSSVEQRKTLLFGHKVSPFKPYKVTLKKNTTIEVDSKVELFIAQVFDRLNVEFEYGPKELLAEYHLKPDFKLHVDNKVYYLEHLGRMDNLGYRERWLRKLETYKKLGLLDGLVTTSECEEKSNIEENIAKLVNDLQAGKLKQTEGYSNHHYEI